MAVQEVNETLLTSASRTATTYSAEFSWADAKARMIVNVTGVTATPTVTPVLEEYDETSGTWGSMWTAAVAQSPTGAARYEYIFTDTAFTPSGASITESKQAYLAPRMRFKMTHADADACIYSVGFNRVNSNNLGV